MPMLLSPELADLMGETHVSFHISVLPERFVRSVRF